jgi:hypothetical protein
MRISDERYHRDLRRLELARRMLALQARTPTVARWTGLSESRIRALYHAYSVVATPTSVPPKGRTPSLVDQFFTSAEVQCDAAILGSFFRHFQVWLEGMEENAVKHLPELSRGERLCHALEEFKALRPGSALTLENGATLLNLLVQGEEIELAKCPDCAGLMLRDRLSVGRVLCPFCAFERHNGLSWRAARKKTVEGPKPEPAAERKVKSGQGSLF